MKIFLFLSIAYALLHPSAAARTTLPVELRIERLKSQLREEIKKANNKALNSYEHSYDDEEYDPNWVVHPVRAPVENLYTFKPLKPTRASHAYDMKPMKKIISRTTAKGHTHKSRSELRAELKAQKKSESEFYMLNPLDIFYRRGLGVFADESDVKWVRNQDSMPPYLAGIKKNPSFRRIIGRRNPIPRRLFEMLKPNTGHYKKDEWNRR